MTKHKSIAVDGPSGAGKSTPGEAAGPQAGLFVCGYRGHLSDRRSAGLPGRSGPGGRGGGDRSGWTAWTSS